MTSAQPERVTCLLCREHARTQHWLAAEQVERLAAMPGSVISDTTARQVAVEHRARAARFAG